MFETFKFTLLSVLKRELFFAFLFLMLAEISSNMLWSQDKKTISSGKNINETNESINSAIELKKSENRASSEIPPKASKIFNEGEFLLNYGLGYSGINDLVYGFTLGKVPVFKTGTYLNMFFIQVGGSFFWVEYFDVGFDSMVGISQSFDSINDNSSRLYLVALKARFIVHYPFETVDIYGGASAGISVGINTGNTTHVALGWSILLGVRFFIQGDFGMYLEAAFPFPWIGIGGYVKLF